MESNIKGLVAAGHEMASELKAECGAVDMRSVAKLISDLATQLEVQLVRANALAAENAGLKSGAMDEIKVINRGGQAYCVKDGVQVNPIYARGWNDYRAKSMQSDTPATDAFLSEIRAEARNEGINYTASRLAAAFNHGFINKSLREVFDVTRMILSAKEELANEAHPIDGLSGEYAEKSLEEWAEQIRKGSSQ
ncbi:hypothetical protein DTY95_02050 [Escherichia coli]|jgi:hypothetical protein|uniref:hypothetical protein n=1 Tax=Escherichia coli TaxID=562 RepID=UPI0016905715|nr:hypothetical protein [Escherichia coli]EFH6803973.1 hypothetical protein [Escherichia coli]EFJ3000803.1 hypothetical protein [Escherichia coli]EFK2617662.1 hypothetical protein [Escherichia coli]EFN1834602.1 hypothetical protein [Escherichia coli]EGD5047312.1 hypothetical protein [Escherichia coli]